MTRLSKILRFSPKIFHVSAIVYIFFSIALPLHEYSRFGYSMQFGTEEAQLKVTVLRYMLNESINALFLLANGFALEVMIAIWDKIRPATGEGAE